VHRVKKKLDMEHLNIMCVGVCVCEIEFFFKWENFEYFFIILTKFKFKHSSQFNIQQIARKFHSLSIPPTPFFFILYHFILKIYYILECFGIFFFYQNLYMSPVSLYPRLFARVWIWICILLNSIRKQNWNCQ
jgi:hypothetical protein